MRCIGQEHAHGAGSDVGAQLPLSRIAALSFTLNAAPTARVSLNDGRSVEQVYAPRVRTVAEFKDDKGRNPAWVPGRVSKRVTGTSD